MGFEMDRRAFLKGTALASAVVVGGGLAACAAPAPADSGAGDATPPTAGSSDVLSAEKVIGKKWTFEIPPEPISEDEIVATEEADIIVIGAGIAGLTVACSAAEAGASVTLIAASSMPLARGGTFHAFKSRVLTEVGLDDPYKGIIGNYIKKEMFSCSYELDQRKWFTFVNNSEIAMNWLLDKMQAAGYECVIENFVPDPEAGVFRTVVGGHSFLGDDIVAPGMGGPLVAKVLEADALKAGVNFVYQTTAKQLIRENSNTGRVTGVIAQNTEGAYTKYVGTNAIILATGDFSADKEMVAKYCPDILPFTAAGLEVDYDVLFQFGGLMPGDGHKMGLWVGAAWQKREECAAMIFTGGPGAAASPSTGLLVDRYGKRVGNEDLVNSYLAKQIKRAPGQSLYGIWGTAAAVANRWAKPAPYGSGTLSPEEVLAGWDGAVESGLMVKGNSLDDVISQLGLPTDETNATIARYNEFAATGEDTDFHKRTSLLQPINGAPYYGMVYTGQDLLTIMGGLRTNELMQVCDENDMPLEGLYNLGTMVGDFYTNLYSLLTPGCNLGGNCLTMGYLTGQAIAKGELR